MVEIKLEFSVTGLIIHEKKDEGFLHWLGP